MALFPTVFESEWVAHLQERAGLDADTEIGFSEPHHCLARHAPGQLSGCRSGMYQVPEQHYLRCDRCRDDA